MIKTQTCITIVCDGCGTEYEHDYTPHYPDSDMAREQTGYEEWVSDEDKLDYCPGCADKPHPFQLKPNTTEDCWRCRYPVRGPRQRDATRDVTGALWRHSVDRSTNRQLHRPRWDPDVTERTFYPPTESDIPMHGWRPYSDMHRERIRAHAKHDAHGGSMERKAFDDPAWLPVLVEEIGEVATLLCDIALGQIPERAQRKLLRDELVQVGAMAAAWIDAIDAPAERAAEANQDGDAEADTVKFHASDLGDPLLFSDLPAWLGDAISDNTITRTAGGEDYWYLRVQTAAGQVIAEPGDTIHRHTDGGLLVRSPDGLCKKVERQDAYGTPITPLLAEEPAICATCEGRGEVNGRPCPQCTIAATPARASGGYLPGGVMYSTGGDSGTPITPPSTPTVDAQDLALAIADPDRQRRGYSHGAA